MPVRFQILPKHGLVYVRYDGFARFEDTNSVFARYASDPEARPGQKHLVDLSRMTGMERDFVKLMEMQAKKADVFMGTGQQTLMVYYAPTPVSLELAHIILRSWEPVDMVIARIQEEETKALTLLGLKVQTFADLLAPSDI